MSINQKKHILQVYNSFLSDSENWSYHQISALANEYKLHIACTHFVDNTFDTSSFDFCIYPHGALIQKAWSLNWFNPTHFFTKLYIRLKTCVLSPVNTYFRQYIAQSKIDLIHFHFADVAWKHMDIAIRNNIPFVVSFYGWDYEKLPNTQPIYKKRYLRIFNAAEKIIVEGPHCKDILIKHGCPKEKIKIIKLGVSKSSIQKQAIEKEQNELNLIQVSALKEKKGVLNTIRAFNEAKKLISNIKLTIGGNSNDKVYKQQVLRLINQLGLQKEITLLGHVELDSLSHVLSQHHVFIHPSQYASDMDCEGGAPIAILNAQACGLPVISTTHCDIPQEVKHNSTGILVNEKNILELKEAIISFYKMDKSTFRDFSSRSIKHVTEEFDIEKNARRLAVLYNHIIKANI